MLPYRQGEDSASTTEALGGVPWQGVPKIIFRLWGQGGRIIPGKNIGDLRLFLNKGKNLQPSRAEAMPWNKIGGRRPLKIFGNRLLQEYTATKI